MKAYWVIFEGQGLGCGVAAIDEADCRSLVDDNAFFAGRVVKSVAEIERFEELDQNHVVPNMGNMFVRGIWFPKGI